MKVKGKYPHSVYGEVSDVGVQFLRAVPAKKVPNKK